MTPVLQTKIPLLFLFGFTAVCALSAAGADHDSRQHTLNAKEIVNRMAQTYASSKTYRDTGTTINVPSILGIVIDQWIDTRPFSTAFVRADHFRFEFKHRYSNSDDWDRYIVHADSSGVRTWWDIDPGVEQEESLGLAVAGATGVSRGAAHTIPVMLMPEVIGGRRITELENLSKLEDGVIDGREYWRVRGKDPIGNLATLWIDPETFLIRRIEERHVHYFILRYDTTTDYSSEVDVQIDPNELKFDPPNKKKKA